MKNDLKIPVMWDVSPKFKFGDIFKIFTKTLKYPKKETREYKNLFPEGVSTNFRNWGYI